MTAAVEGVSGQQHASSALYPRERPGTHFTGGWVGTRAGLDGRKISSRLEIYILIITLIFKFQRAYHSCETEYIRGIVVSQFLRRVISYITAMCLTSSADTWQKQIQECVTYNLNQDMWQLGDLFVFTHVFSFWPLPRRIFFASYFKMLVRNKLSLGSTTAHLWQN